MQKLLYLPSVILMLITAACQQQATQQASPTTTLAATPVSTVTPDPRRFLEQYDLSELWQPLEAGKTSPMEGFRGADHYRVQVVLLTVQKDPRHPRVYHVTGKDRFKGRIIPFTGTITLQSVKDLMTVTKAETTPPMGPEANAYTAVGSFLFNEERGRPGSGTLAGKLAVDFYLDMGRPGRLSIFTQSTDATAASPTRDAGSLFEGTWRSYQTGEQKPTIWAFNFLSVASEILQDFNIGERDVTINPKYAKLGWDEYWTNEEWWAEPGPGMARVSADSL